MDKNIFEGAKFADKFVTKNGRYASLYKVFNHHARIGANYAMLLLEDDDSLYQGIHRYRLNGSEVDGNNDLDIVSRYQEPIDEEYLDELARNFADKRQTDYGYDTDWTPLYIGYKAGYKKE